LRAKLKKATEGVDRRQRLCHKMASFVTALCFLAAQNARGRCNGL